MSFIFNRWVRGDDFYGRESLLASLSTVENRNFWVLGNRRVGKTSLLRQIRWLCGQGSLDAEALYWDLQGAGSVDGLKDSLLESLEDAPDICDLLSLDVDDLEDGSFYDVINKFRRKTRQLKGKTFYLLIDECEELVDVAAEDPQVLASFRKLSNTSAITIVMAGSLRMMDLDETASRTSPFLPDFLPPLRLGPFSVEDSIALLTANQLARDEAIAIHNLAFGNPHLVQVIGEHFQRTADLNATLMELKRNKVCHYFYQSNFQCLPVHMRSWWKEGKAVEKLSALSPDDLDFPFIIQSALVRLNGEQCEIAPLLLMEERDVMPELSALSRPASSPALPPRPPARTASAPPSRKSTPIDAFLASFPEHARRLSVLPQEQLESGDWSELNEARNPPGLDLMATLGETRTQMNGTLDGASPEYLLGQTPDERTAVYLAGIVLYRSVYGASPFREITDPWQRAAAIADRDVLIQPDPNISLDPRLAMILMRALKADPGHRYPSLAALSSDLKQL